MKTNTYLAGIFSLCLSISTIFFLQPCFAQSVIKGEVHYANDGAPAVFANIELLNGKSIKTLSDNAGSFHLNISNSQKKDTVVISSVGYKSIRMPVSEALKKSVFTLSEIIRTIEAVTVFNSHELVGSTSETVGFYRSWDYKNKGGEIGRIFKVPYKKFKLDKIRFKAGNTCDTCSLRLHIRYLENGQPGDEIFRDSVTVLVNSLSLDSKISEFDLTPYDFTFTESDFFVGIELLNCGNGKKGFCSFNFAGTEKGEYLYKSNAGNQWESSNDYTIFLKLFLRY
jgi:hypothetical protein